MDGQPDGTVARKRFWRGNFLFAIDPGLGSAGFKRFRPVIRDRITGKWRHLANAELPDYSQDQYAAGVEGFYDKMDDVLSPAPLDPQQALLETIDALEEQVKTRVTSLDNGRKFLASGKATAEMPEGAKIFETTGDWEDFSTPSRDLRLLIAIDVVSTFPARFARRPDRYAMPAGKTPSQVRADLGGAPREGAARAQVRVRAQRRQRLGARAGGSRRAGDAARDGVQPEIECAEARWGAPAGSDEASTCKGHAPPAQTAKMASYRSTVSTSANDPPEVKASPGDEWGSVRDEGG